MTSTVSPRRAPALKPLALATALSLLALAAGARADDQILPDVTITGARFESDPALAPVGATVITADAIRAAGAGDVNEAIRKVGGVYGRQSLDASSDFGLDLRGFGSNSAQNLVILVDGVRLADSDLAGAVVSTIPVETVERIEIVRGGSSVLFGDGATGGVIRIFTKRAAKPGLHGTVRAEAGQFGLGDLRAALTQTWGNFTLDAALGQRQTDNDREHNAFEQRTFSGGATWRFGGGRAGLRLESARQDAEFAGSLTQAQFEADPRQASTRDNFGALDSDRATAFIEQRLGSVDLAAELSQRRKTVESTYYFDGFPSFLSYESRQTQFSPRLRHLAERGAVLNEFVAGADLLRWERTTSSAFGATDEDQKSRGLYLRDELTWRDARNARLAIGARHEKVERAAPFGDSSDESVNAWDVQGSVDAAPKAKLYAKAGRSFRLPTADENGYRNGAPLRIQRSRDLELGLVGGDAALGLTVRVFRHALEDEIFFDPTVGQFGANANLDPTERRGFELDGHVALPYQLRLSAQLQHVKARFTDGVNDGRDMVLVPKNVLGARLAWAPGNGHSADVGAQWVDRQRFGSDFDNSCSARIASYTTVDARYALQAGAWEFAVAALNLGDKQYYSNAFGCRFGIYPSDGRQLKASLRYDF